MGGGARVSYSGAFHRTQGIARWTYSQTRRFYSCNGYSKRQFIDVDESI